MFDVSSPSLCQESIPNKAILWTYPWIILQGVCDTPLEFSLSYFLSLMQGSLVSNESGQAGWTGWTCRIHGA